MLKETLPSGNQLVKSDQHYCMVLNDDGSAQPAIIDVKSTQLKVSRRWKTQIAMFKIQDKNGEFKQYALVATIVANLKTVEESNDWVHGTISMLKKSIWLIPRLCLMKRKTFRSFSDEREAKAVAENLEGEETPF